MKRYLILAALLAEAFSLTARAADGAPKFIEYQGIVQDAQGALLAPTVPRLYKMEFRLFNQLEGGTLIWSEQQFVNVSNGQFSVRLGEGQAATDPVAPQFMQNDLGSAFNGKDRFIGITVITNAASKSEISPRLVFQSAPYALVANAASRAIQKPGTFSDMVLGAIAYSTQTTPGTSNVSLALDKRVNLISASASGTTATLPTSGAFQELVVIKTDTSTKSITVTAPGGGKINAVSSVRLKAKGESITVQNVGNNDWWIVKDSRDTTPVGTIIAYGGANPPAGYLPCDGTTAQGTDHPDLFNILGNTWGASSGSTFRLPNLTGKFLRGINPGNPGADEDYGLRLAQFTGGNSGLMVGSAQTDQLFKHSHSITDPGHDHTASFGGQSTILITFSTAVVDHSDSDNAPGFQKRESGPSTNYTMNFTSDVKEEFTGITQTGNMSSTPGQETRPENAGVRYCIKF